MKHTPHVKTAERVVSGQGRQELANISYMESLMSRPGLGAITLMPNILFYHFIRLKEYITLALDRMYNFRYFLRIRRFIRSLIASGYIPADNIDGNPKIKHKSTSTFRANTRDNGREPHGLR